MGAGVGTYMVLTSNDTAVLPLLYVLMPGVAMGMFIHSNHILPFASAVTNAVFFSAVLIFIRRVWVGLRRRGETCETPPPVI